MYFKPQNATASYNAKVASVTDFKRSSDRIFLSGKF